MGHEYSLTFWFCAWYLVRCTPLNYIFIVSLTATMLTSINVRVESYMLQSYECIVRRHLRAGRGMMIACICTKFRKWRCTEVQMDMLEFSGWGLQAQITLTVNCTLRSSHFLRWALNIVSLQTSLLMEIGSHNLFSDTSFNGPNIQVSQNGVMSAFKVLKT